jgi:hypothetical protein
MGVPAGPWYIDDTLTFTVITHRVDTGALTDADAVPSYRVYEDETGTAILTGSMAKLDDTNTTGFYSEQLTLSAANGFEVGKSYGIYVTAAVNSVTGGQTFNFKVIATPTTPPTAAAIADAVWDEDATAHQTQGTFGQAIGDPGADTDTIWGLVNTNLNATVSSRAAQTTADAIETDTQDIQSRLPAALVSGRIDASVGAMAANTLTASALAADAVTEIQSGLSTLDAAGVRTAVGLASANLDTQLETIDNFLDTEIAAIKTKTDQLTFTVANQLDANVQYVNDVVVTGTGAAGDEWGP